MNLRRISSISCALALGFLAGGLQAQTGAASGPGSKVAIISVQGVIAGTKEGQSASQQLNTKYGPKQKEMQARQAEIQQLNDQLQKGGNLLTAEKRDELNREIDSKTKRYQRDMQDAQEEVQQDQQRLFGGISQKLLPIIEKYAKDHGYSLVLDVSNPNTPVLYASTSADITKDIIALYDQAAPTAPTGGTAPKVPGSTTKSPNTLR
jgi:outer membrane protein